VSLLVHAAVLWLATAVPVLGLWPSVFPMLPQDGSAPQDGSQTGDFAGPGHVQMRIASHNLKARNEALAQAEAVIAQLLPAVRAVAGAEKQKERAELRAALSDIAGKPLDDCQAALLQALDHEERRLRMVRKAIEAAAREKKTVPGVDAALVESLRRFIADGKAKERALTRVRAFRFLASGLVAFLDDDPPTAVARMKAATDAGPDLAPAWVYLGSFYFLVQKVDLAVAAWRRALALDPSNEAVRRALRDYDLKHGGRKPKKGRKQGRK